MQVKDWVFVGGVAIILLVALAQITDGSSRYHAPNIRRGRLLGIRGGYACALIDLLCAVNFLEWRRGLVDLGVPNALSWVLAPAGLIVVIAVSVVSWSMSYGEHERVHWSKWLGAFILFLATAAGYLTVAGAQWT
jgi:hypothetical protein